MSGRTLSCSFTAVRQELVGFNDIFLKRKERESAARSSLSPSTNLLSLLEKRVVDPQQGGGLCLLF